MKILALDLGKSKTVACVYESGESEPRYQSVRSTPSALHDLIVDVEADRVVFEIGSSAGWLADLVRTLEIELQVVNVAHDAWRWRNVRAKSDRLDALKLAELSAVNQLSLVHVPQRSVRQWRSLIAYRKQVVGRRTQIQNTIRAILDREGLTMPAGRKGWSSDSIQDLRKLAKLLSEAGPDDIWRGQLWLELEAWSAVNEWMAQLEARLDQLVKTDARCGRLMTIPGVGPRLAEAVVAVIDDPKRFKSGRRISRAGNTQLRTLLVEVAWIGLRCNAWMRQVYEQVRRGSPARKKTAIVAVARRLLVVCWAMLRDDTPWCEPVATDAA